MGTLTMCRKAGRLVLGLELTKEACVNKTAKAVIAADDISENTLKEVRYYCKRYDIPLYSLGMTMDKAGEALGKRTGVLAVCDSGFAKALGKQLVRLQDDTDETGGK